MEMKKYKLGELMDVTRGQSLSGEYYSKSGNLVRLTLGNFDYHNNCFKDDKSKDNLYFTGSVKKEFILKKDDIITPLTEQAIGLLGSTAKIPCSGKYIQSQDVALIKCNKKLNPDFAFYLIPSKIVRNQLSAAAQQTKIRHTSPDKIKDCSVWVPEYSEQEKIGKLLSRIDNKIAINRQINRNLEELAKQIYDYWFVQFDFPNKEGKPYKSSGGKMVWNETLKREIPAGWKNGVLSNIAYITMGQSPEGSSYNEDGIGTIFYQGSTDFGIRFPNVRMYTTKPTRFAKIGDILMSVRAPVGAMNIANSDCCIGRGLSAMNSKIGSITHLYYTMDYFRHTFENKNAVGTTFGSITKDELYNLPVVIPSKEVISAFNVKTIYIFNQQLSTSKEIQELTALRDSLLPLLMNGQVTLNSCLSLIIHLYNTIFARFNFTTRNSK